MISWELGGGLGHHIPIMALTHEFVKRNVEVTLVLKNITNRILKNLPNNVKVIQAPENDSKLLSTSLSSISDILYDNGYHNTEAIKTLINKWINIIDLVKPDLIINDYAPSSVLAGKLRNINTVNIGTGFFIPPICKDLIFFRNREDVNIEKSIFTEKSILKSINTIFSEKLSLYVFNTVTESLRADRNFISTFRELDHYKYLRPANTDIFIGNIFYNFYKDRTLIDYSDRRVFLYVKKEFDGIIELLKEIIVSGMKVIAYIENPGFEIVELLKDTNVYLSDTIINVDEILKNCDLVICNAGSSTIAQTIKQAIPVIMLPMQQEQNLLASVVQEAGYGISVKKNEIVNNFRYLLEETISDTQIKNQLLEFKSKYNSERYNNSASFIVQEILSEGFLW
jgi:uncharacterized protein (TIGR00661 family)